MSAVALSPHPLATFVVDSVDEITPEPYLELRPSGSTAQRIIVSLVVFGPFVGLVVALISLWGSSIRPLDLITGALFYVASGLGVTIGFHRLLTHRSFVARRWLRIALAVAGSFAIEGSATSWVALHRRHHVYSDRAGDPHSPNLSGTSPLQRFKGFVHAHAGWLYTAEESNAERWAPDLVADPDIAMVSKLAPLWAVLSLLLPFLIGLAVTRTLEGAFVCFLWAGAVRIFFLHHVTWSTNSICHIFGRRPFESKDRSRNFALLALLSFGESWHNGHHAFPSSARHGLERGQLDISARLIAILAGLGWVTDVRRPDPIRLEARRRLG